MAACLVVDLCWIPAHVGIGGNEACDVVAKHALKPENITQIPLGPSEIIRLAKDQMEKKKWQFQWDSSTKGRFCDTVYPDVVPPVKLPMLSRRDQVALGGLRLGHCRLNSYLYKIGCHPPGFCETCRKPEDLNHLFLNFLLSEGPRRHLVQKVGVMGIKVLDLPGVLRLMNQKHPQLCKLVLKFV